MEWYVVCVVCMEWYVCMYGMHEMVCIICMVRYVFVLFVIQRSFTLRSTWHRKDNACKGKRCGRQTYKGHVLRAGRRTSDILIQTVGDTGGFVFIQNVFVSDSSCLFSLAPVKIIIFW